jgi:hypothetical protein
MRSKNFGRFSTARVFDRPGRRSMVPIMAAVMALSGLPPVTMLAAAQPGIPGGFLEPTTSAEVRPRVLPDLPDRGPFTFPAPYGTAGIRITNASDCGGDDCVGPVGYSYWRNTNNHAGSDTILLFLHLDRFRGGSGSTLFSVSKLTGAVQVLGPLFDDDTPLAWGSGEGWYFSATRPTTLYALAGSRLYRYDVLSRQLETVFDVTAPFGGDTHLSQAHSSHDDRVHSATLQSDAGDLGCVVYREDTRQLSLYATMGDFDECQVDKSGRWLLIKEDVDGVNYEDNRIIDLETGAENLFLDEAGAAGHSDSGFGYMVAEDNWYDLPGAVRVWTFGQLLPGVSPQGQLVYHTTDWGTSLGHLTHTNAVDGPSGSQIACGSNAERAALPRANEIVCFRLDGSLQVLVVAPVMTDLDAGGGDDYTRQPKGNLDVSGQYFIWTSNVGGNRLDAFLVKVPMHLLGGSPPPQPPSPPPSVDVIPPDVSVTAPAAGATVSGTLAMTAIASDNVAVSGVRFMLNGASVGAEITAPPFDLRLSLAGLTGPYTITAVARDATGNSTTSAPVTVTVAAGGGTVPGAAPVFWTKLVNVTATGSTLRKTGGCDGCPDAGAISRERLGAAGGTLQFTASETSGVRSIGLSHGNPGTSAGEIRFAISLHDGSAEVWESGAYRTDISFATGDVFSIVVAGGVVVYAKNGAVFYHSPVRPVFPLLVDTSLSSLHATLQDVTIVRGRSARIVGRPR